MLSTGGRSRFVPKHLREQYDAILQDPDLLSLRHAIALLDVRSDEVLQQITSSDAMRTLQIAASAYRQGNANAEDLLRAIDGCQDVQASWQEWSNLQEQRRRTSDSEVQRLVKAQQMLSSEQALALVTVLLSSVKRHVTDRATLAAITADLRPILDGPRPS